MLRSSSSSRFSLRRTALVGILVAAIGGLSFTGVTAANATNDAQVGSYSDLENNLLSGYTPLHLSQNIDYENGGDVLLVYNNATIDLNGFSLNVRGIVMAGGSTLTFEDLSADGGGAVYTNAVGEGVPGIDVSSGSTLNVENGVHIRATGASGYAGIGSGAGVLDPVDLSDNTYLHGVGTINVDNGSVDAYAGSGAAAIGGGSGLTGGTLNIGAHGSVTASADSGQSVLGAGQGGSGFGSLDVAGSLDVSDGQLLDVPGGSSATVESTGTISGDDNGDGSLSVEGSIANAGAISLPAANITGASNITGNNFVLTFHSAPADEPGSLPADAESETVDVLAPTMTAGNRQTPTDYTGPGDYVSSWTAEDTPWDVNTPLTPDDLELYGVYSELTSITLTSNKTSTPDGTAIALTVTGHGPGGVTDDQTPYASITTTGVADDATTSGTIVLHGTGTRSVSALVVSHSGGGAHVGPSNVLSLIATGPLSSGMTITPTKLTIAAGIPSTFAVTGKDAGGASLGDITNQVTWSGTSASKGDSIDPTTHEPVFGKVGTRTLKATIGKHSVTATVKVVAGAAATLTFVKPATTAVAGTPVSFTVDAADVAGNPLGNVTGDTTFGVADPVSGESAIGNEVTMTQAGDRTVAAIDGTASITTPIVVAAAAGDQYLAGAPFPNDTPFDVDAATTVTYTPTVEDVYGNILTAAQVADSIHFSLADYFTGAPITSATIDHNQLTYNQQGVFSVTMDVGAATDTFNKEVNTGSLVVPAALTFDFAPANQYVGGSLDLSASPADAGGNPGDSAVIATFTSSPKGATVVTSGTTAHVTFPKVGKYTITAAAVGFPKLSEKFTVIQDTATPAFSTSPITASIKSTFDVSLPTGGSGIAPTGSLTLHYGTKSIKEQITSGLMEFPLPALKVGKYTFYASYSGDSLYAAKSSAKVSVLVVPGVLDHLAFVKAPTSVVAGTVTKYVVDGYDVNDNLIGADTHATYAIADQGTYDTVSGNSVTLTVVGAQTVTATDGLISVETHPTVTIGPAATLQDNVNNYTVRVEAGQPATFTATASDAYGNSYGDVSSKLVLTNTTGSAGKFVKNVGTFTLAGTQSVTAKFGSATAPYTANVLPASADGKYRFTSPATSAVVGGFVGLEIAQEDKYGNVAGEPVSADDVSLSSTPSTGVTIDHTNQFATFNAPGTFKLVAVYAGVTVSESVKVGKATPSVSFSTANLSTAPGQFLSVLVAGDNPPPLAPTGTVTLHFGSHTFTAQALSDTANSGATTFTLGTLTAGTYTVYATYSGDTDFNSVTSAKVTITVTPGA